jgi:uncharacterized protein YyaL (SSP411 family)
MSKQGEDMPNRNNLINESSPYLQQHAHNPVNWYPWGEEAFKRAAEEEKPLIISIGYSSCHWCHVMEDESFENSDVAQIMNENFICIKVDREERPDIDSYYMNALQMLSGRGGWPLNMMALSNGKPFYGGTYFPRENWIHLLNQLAAMYKNKRDELVSVALSVEKGIANSHLNLLNSQLSDYSLEELTSSVKNIRTQFDRTWGGIQGAPKFPMPVAYRFLLSWSHLRNDQEIQDFVLLTLDRMASGGIYDQIGGGFARYSTDVRWKVPHFEKMLYDNAQLVSLFSDAYRLTGKERYKEVVTQTLDFIDEKMTSSEGLFYSAMDADSQGEEGLYYTWEVDELRDLLGGDYPVAREYFGIGGEGAWEMGRNILLALPDNKGEYPNRETLSRIRGILKEAREKRIPPAIDDKSLTAWNALMITAYTEAYKAFGDSRYLDRALRATDFILKNFITTKDGLYRSYREGKTYIEGFLEDYAQLIRALIALFEISGVAKYLNAALKWCNYTIDTFSSGEGLFFYAASRQDGVIQKDVELTDITIPSSNAVMAHNLFLLGKLTGNSSFEKRSKNLTGRINKRVLKSSFYFSHWAELMLYQRLSYYEIVLVGPEAESLCREMTSSFLPNAVFAYSNQANESNPLFKERYKEGETFIYICRNNSCGLPVRTVEEALSQIL